MEQGLQDSQFVQNHFDEILSLTELPMKKLLHVRRTFMDSDYQDSYLDDTTTDIGNVSIGKTTAKTDDNPEAQALTGGHSKKVNPLLNGRGSSRGKTSCVVVAAEVEDMDLGNHHHQKVKAKRVAFPAYFKCP
ncbi:hypothetical protein L9F63_001101 [Diploptera punctata]|uniref:Uncharacterized protein n=1 Tax=Diploptera punctata TaxID=6984 RepID=A0AAD8ESJ8_DIPPU|nr:hypothetical protein L9F63_001101 [Diploptera punctata]